jgi:hypothetical protein
MACISSKYHVTLKCVTRHGDGLRSHLGCADCKKRPRGISKHKKREKKHTLSIPSISRALFVPLGGGGGATELLSSLPLAEEPGASDPRPRFLVVEANEGLPEAARRCASMSFLRFAASSLFSSVSLRMRSCETQSSHLQKWSACRLGDLRCRLRYNRYLAGSSGWFYIKVAASIACKVPIVSSSRRDRDAR